LVCLRKDLGSGSDKFRQSSGNGRNCDLSLENVSDDLRLANSLLERSFLGMLVPIMARFQSILFLPESFYLCCKSVLQLSILAYQLNWSVRDTTRRLLSECSSCRRRNGFGTCKNSCLSSIFHDISRTLKDQTGHEPATSNLDVHDSKH
jgi:hypothetical protein